MAKISKEEEQRRAGMAYALKIAREKGIEGLEEEVKFRNITKCPIAIKKETAVEFFEEDKRNCIRTIGTMAMLALHDEFGFNKKRLGRFWQNFMRKTECMVEGYTDWQATTDILAEECSMKIDLPDEFYAMNKAMEG